ncbi:NYN domain-containing protein (plasmid) [Methylomarinum sp. Ch1-1]|uniref:NYN domain-containing protein n=1 Tax=Methylomarinum roseum TaxID=3067653 RepID=A0AAU7P0G1_9GAMM|nr:NYN domain-containing protein [Methylomarinum sp. Ch1-1]MDP4518943.1 NYN domain-containing protein [Methylomarinum sp. Ch1-1]MDP4523344.1 NYN domain-containing protein [Methylomarinum sp. Ch1-1]
MKKRAVIFVDGFNLHHAISDLGKEHYKWLDLTKLSEEFLPRSHFSIAKVFYFSAYAAWIPSEHKRHKRYIEALKATGVTPILGHFKKKENSCKCCDHTWTRHEEKETDVNIALHILNEGYQDSYDTAMIISADSDLAPAITMTKQAFPDKKFKVITPPGKNHCFNLEAATGVPPKRIRECHLARSLLPEQLISAQGNLIIRPERYEPPEIEDGASPSSKSSEKPGSLGPGGIAQD